MGWRRGMLGPRLLAGVSRLQGEEEAMILRIQFWSRYRGRVDTIVNTKAGNAISLALIAVDDALSKFNQKWPATHLDEIHLVGAEQLRTGIAAHDGHMPQ